MPGRLVCFVCGNIGVETSIHVKPQDSGPFFPFLEHHDPPKGSRQPAYDGSVDCCRVCFAFLTTQWDLYERSKTPAIKRLYWLKRADNGNFTGAEMRLQGEYIAQVMGLQYQPGSFDLDNALSPENPAIESNFHTRSRSQSTRPQPQSFSHQVHQEQREATSSKPYDSALDLSTPKKEFDHFKANKGTGAARTPDSQDFSCFVCGQQQSLSHGSYINIFQQNATEPYFPVLESIKPYPGSEQITRSGQAKVCGHCKTILYHQWQSYETSGTPVSLRTYKIPAKQLKGVEGERDKTDRRGDLNSNFVCYICGISNTVASAGLLNTLPPKSPSSIVMFFPFIRELDRPRGAEPLRPDGSVLACDKCYGSLSHQWQVQEVEGVPLYHRNYSLHFLSAKQSMQDIKSSASNADSEPVKPLNIQISMASPVQKSRDPVTSVFPTTQGLLAIAPVLSSEDSSSPSKFHDSMIDSRTSVSDSANYTGGVKTVPHPLQQVSVIPKKVCFLCGERCIISKMHYVNAYPAKHEAKHASSQTEPFFPFLTSCEPATKADPVTDDGIVIACNICFHTLMKQWSEYEQSKNPSDSNRWLRKYSLPNYSCYVCAAVCERKYLRSLETEKFQFLKEHKASPESLVMDEGEKVAVCKPCAYSLMKQFSEYERMGLPAELRKYNWIQKAPVMFEDSAPDDESQDEHRFENYHGLSYHQQTGPAQERDRHSGDHERNTETGGQAGSKPPLSMMSPAGNKLQRNTATVSPLDHVTSPTNGVTSIGANAALNASRTSSFAAALRKLANQAKDAPGEEANKTSTANSPREATTKTGPPPLVCTSTPLTMPPVVTIAPTQAHPSLLSSDVRPPLERLHSSHSTSSLFDSAHGKPDRERPQSSASRDDGRASRDGHSQSNRRVTPHSTPGTTPPLSGREETARGFQPYRPGDDLRPGLPSSLALEQAAAAAAAYSYPSFLPPHAFPHPAFRFDDPLLLERYRMMQHPYLPYGAPGMLPHPSLHPLMAAGGRYPPELLHPHLAFNSQAGRIPEHRSPSLHPDRRLEEEKRELEREREKERERERERDMAIYRERQRALERESEKQRDRDRSSHREREEREKRDSADKPKSEVTVGKADESLSAKFGSIIQGTPKGLGIADRYPRAPSSSHSASLTLGKREEQRDGKDDSSRSSSFLNSSFNRLMTHKSSSRDDSKTSELDKRYSLVTPMTSSERNGPPPLISPKPGEVKPKSEGSLFRPFDSKILTNGYENQHHERDKLIHHRPELDTKKLELDRGYTVGHVSYDPKSIFPPSGEKSLHSSKFGSSASAFHSLDSKAVKDLSKPNTDSKNVQSTHSICSPLHHSSHKESFPFPTLHNSNQTPLNVPAYNAKNILSSSKIFPESQQSCVSKLDLEERKMSESRSNGSYCSDSDCDIDSEDNEDVKNLLIASGPPLQLDTSRRKMSLLKELGLTTHRHKKDKQFELFRVRRRKMHERSLSPMNVEETEQRLSPLKCTYPPDLLCREPDYKMKCQFLSQMCRLEPVPATTRLLNEIIYKAVEEDRRRRLKRRRLQQESSDDGTNSDQSGDSGEDSKVNISQSTCSSLITSASQKNYVTSQSDINRLYSVTNNSADSLSQLSDLTTSVMRRTSDVKTEPGVISSSREKLSKSFAEEFHRSVLQTTRQKEISQKSGEVSIQGHSSRHEGHSSRSFQGHQHGIDQWPGIETVMETYQRHNTDGNQERQLLVNRTKSLKLENKELSKSAEILSKRMEDLLKNKRQLEEERQYRQTRIDGLKSAIKKLKN